jgi:hypothetical protein
MPEKQNNWLLVFKICKILGFIFNCISVEIQSYNNDQDHHESIGIIYTIVKTRNELNTTFIVFLDFIFN